MKWVVEYRHFLTGISISEVSGPETISVKIALQRNGARVELFPGEVEDADVVLTYEGKDKILIRYRDGNKRKRIRSGQRVKGPLKKGKMIVWADPPPCVEESKDFRIGFGRLLKFEMAAGAFLFTWLFFALVFPSIPPLLRIIPICFFILWGINLVITSLLSFFHPRKCIVWEDVFRFSAYISVLHLAIVFFVYSLPCLAPVSDVVLTILFALLMSLPYAVWEGLIGRLIWGNKRKIDPFIRIAIAEMVLFLIAFPISKTRIVQLILLPSYPSCAGLVSPLSTQTPDQIIDEMKKDLGLEK